MKNQHAFGLLEVIISAALMGLVGAGVAKLWDQFGKSTTTASASRTALQLRANIQQLVNSPSAWSRTIAAHADGTLKCLAEAPKGDCTGQTGPISLYNGANQIEIDTKAGAGFTLGGAPCSDYSDSGNNSCPFRVDLEWEPLCSQPVGQPCTSPQVRVTGAIKFRNKTENRSLAFNEGNYAINIIRGHGGSSMSEICVAVGGSWDESAGQCNLAPLVCATLGGSFDVEAGRCDLPINGGCSAPDQAINSLSFSKGQLTANCIAVSDDFDPFNYRVVARAWSDNELKKIPQDELQGCAVDAASPTGEYNALRCRQDRPAGSPGTCYFRTPVVNGIPRPAQSGWFRVGSGFCRGAVFINESYTPPFSPY